MPFDLQVIRSNTQYLSITPLTRGRGSHRNHTLPLRKYHHEAHLTSPYRAPNRISCRPYFPPRIRIPAHACLHTLHVASWHRMCTPSQPYPKHQLTTASCQLRQPQRSSSSYRVLLAGLHKSACLSISRGRCCQPPNLLVATSHRDIV